MKPWDLQTHLKSGERFGFSLLRRPCSKIVCYDGFQVSVQASTSHYSTPRDDKGPYTHVEVGYPSEPVEAWMEYAEDSDRPTTTVYPYVPIELVEAVLEAHGGVDWTATVWEINSTEEKENGC
jgi:hypothetical protein